MESQRRFLWDSRIFKTVFRGLQKDFRSESKAGVSGMGSQLHADFVYLRKKNPATEKRFPAHKKRALGTRVYLAKA